MCGIAVVRSAESADRTRTLHHMLSELAHRGQPGCQQEADDLARWEVGIGTNRLAIVAPQHGRQPVTAPGGRCVLAFNGEVFNHRALAAELWGPNGLPGPAPDNDTAVLAAAIERWGPVATVRRLRWEGAFVCLDLTDGTIWAGRDHLGIKPLYQAWSGTTLLWASEIKALVPYADGDIWPVLPGTVVRQRPGRGDGEVRTWWRATEQRETRGPQEDADDLAEELLDLIREAVRSRVPDRRYAVALSGGIDSSLVLRLAHEVNPHVTAYVLSRPGSPDLPFAAELCRRLDVPLVRVPAPPPQQLAVYLPEVVRSIETWEWHVVNHAAPMISLMDRIRRDGHQIVLTGEGADELFCGYGAADQRRTLADIRTERLDRLRDLHRTNCRRLDRIGMRSTLECRVPILDRALTEFALNLHPDWMIRGGEKKWLLRSAAERVLPPGFAWRSKLSFARGAGYQYSADTVSSVFGDPEPSGPLPSEWADAPRFPTEHEFLRHFIRFGYGRASYLRSRSR